MHGATDVIIQPVFGKPAVHFSGANCARRSSSSPENLHSGSSASFSRKIHTTGKPSMSASMTEGAGYQSAHKSDPRPWRHSATLSSCAPHREGCLRTARSYDLHSAVAPSALPEKGRH